MGDNSGFTLIEILVAVFIMAIGFFALSQMQYLSLRQSQLAEQGTIATNIIQSVSERELSQIKNLHSLNLDLISRNGSSEFCEGDGNICNNTCPCDPFYAIMDNPAANESRCIPIDSETFDPGGVFSNANDCDDISENFYLISTIIPSLGGDYTITYGVKTREQLLDSAFNLDIRNTLATQHMIIATIARMIELSERTDINTNIMILPNIP